MVDNRTEHLSPDQARAASVEHVVRYVLIASLLLAVMAMLIVLMIG